jgi:hypothetical protein
LADGARHQLRAVTTPSAHIEYLHAGTSADEGKDLKGIAASVGRTVGRAAVGRSN